MALFDMRQADSLRKIRAGFGDVFGLGEDVYNTNKKALRSFYVSEDNEKGLKEVKKLGKTIDSWASAIKKLEREVRYLTKISDMARSAAAIRPKYTKLTVLKRLKEIARELGKSEREFKAMEVDGVNDFAVIEIALKLSIVLGMVESLGKDVDTFIRRMDSYLKEV